MFFITRAVLTMFFWVIVARWSYAEIAKFSPTMRASVDSLLELATIPTHDQWDTTKMREIGEQIVSALRVDEAFAGQGE